MFYFKTIFLKMKKRQGYEQEEENVNFYFSLINYQSILVGCVIMPNHTYEKAHHS